MKTTFSSKWRVRVQKKRTIVQVQRQDNRKQLKQHLDNKNIYYPTLANSHTFVIDRIYSTEGSKDCSFHV